MIKHRIRRWAWTCAALFAALSFFILAVILQRPFTYALIAASICGAIPLIIAGGLLFSPSDSVKSPLRYMAYKPPSITHSAEPEKPKVVPRPTKKSKRRQ